MTNPPGWTLGDELGYQLEISNLKARIAAAGSSDEVEIVQAELAAMSAKDGRTHYLWVKASGLTN